MNASQFYQYIQNPDRMGIHDEVQLRGLLKEYPYFQSAHILLAKCLKNMDNYMFEKQLRLAALYAPNRTMLYTLLKNTDVSRQQAASSPSSVLVETESQAAVDEEVIVGEAESVEPSMLPENTYEVYTIEPDAEETYQHEFRDEATPMETDAVDDVEDLRSFEEMRDALKNIITSIEERVADGQTQIVEEHLAEREIIVAASVIETPPADTRDLQAAEDIMDEGLEKLKEQMVATTEVRSFADWLNLKSPTQEETKVLPKPSEEEIRKIDFVAALETRVAEPVKSLLDMDSILENFIRHTPTISRPKAEFFNPVKSAKKSVEEDEDIATETLARIVLKQGNAPKAIRIYEKLILKYPDKSPIFAAQIEKIKQDNQLN